MTHVEHDHRLLAVARSQARRNPPAQALPSDVAFLNEVLRPLGKFLALLAQWIDIGSLDDETRVQTAHHLQYVATAWRDQMIRPPSGAGESLPAVEGSRRQLPPSAS